MKISEIKNVIYFAKGHRGILYMGDYKKKKVVIKTKRKGSEAIGRIENEANYLKMLNQKGIGPKFLYYDMKKDFLVYEYVNGIFFPLFLEHASKKSKNQIKKVIRQLFIQCFRMDRMKTNKEEMHHPYKHVLIESKTKKPVLIDFERCHKSIEPVNVTQFSSYIISDFMVNLLKDRGIKVNREKIIAAAKKYKKNISKSNLENILKNIN